MGRDHAQDIAAIVALGLLSGTGVAWAVDHLADDVGQTVWKVTYTGKK